MCSPRVLAAAVLALSVLALQLGAAAATTVPVTDANWFFTPLNWLHYSDESSGLTLAQAVNPGAYFKVAFTGSSSVSLLLEQSGAPSSPYMVLRWTVDDLPFQEVQLPLPADSGSSSSSSSAFASPLRSTRHSSSRRRRPASVAALALASGLAADANHTVYVLVRASSQSTDRWQTPLCRVRVAGLRLDDGAATVQYQQQQLRPRRALVFWDSIGEGVCTMGRGHGDLLDNDAAHAWPFALAAALGAEVSLAAFGCQGYLVAGCGGVPPLIDLDDAAKSAWSHYDLTHSRLSADGLLLPEPDFLFNGHGTNDAFHHISADNVTRASLAWLLAARAAAPHAHIFLTVPFGGFHRDALAAAYTQYVQTTGGRDGALHLLDLGVDAQLGLTAGDSRKPSAMASDGVHPWYYRSAQLGAMLAVEVQRLLVAGVRTQ